MDGHHDGLGCPRPLADVVLEALRGARTVLLLGPRAAALHGDLDVNTTALVRGLGDAHTLVRAGVTTLAGSFDLLPGTTEFDAVVCLDHPEDLRGPEGAACTWRDVLRWQRDLLASHGVVVTVVPNALGVGALREGTTDPDAATWRDVAELDPMVVLPDARSAEIAAPPDLLPDALTRSLLVDDVWERAVESGVVAALAGDWLLVDPPLPRVAYEPVTPSAEAAPAAESRDPLVEHHLRRTLRSDGEAAFRAELADFLIWVAEGDRLCTARSTVRTADGFAAIEQAARRRSETEAVLGAVHDLALALQEHPDEAPWPVDDTEKLVVRLLDLVGADLDDATLSSATLVLRRRGVRARPSRR